MTSIDVGAIERALQTLYTDLDPVNKKEAEKWLTQVQTMSGPETWDLSWHLLSGDMIFLLYLFI